MTYTLHLPNVAAHYAPVPELLRLVNVERTANGLHRLVAHDGLTKAAQGWAEYMRDNGIFEHGEWAQRVADCYPGWRTIGENLAAGYPTFESVVAAWMDSPGHRANILNANFEEAGVGFAVGGTWRWLYVMDYGARFKM